MQENERKQNRAKQARFRRRHRVRLGLAALARDRGPNGRRPGWRAVELVDRDGVPVAVFACRADRLPVVPADLRESTKWLPALVVSRATARRLVRLRCEQVVRWSGGSWRNRTAGL